VVDHSDLIDGFILSGPPPSICLQNPRAGLSTIGEEMGKTRTPFDLARRDEKKWTLHRRSPLRKFT